jgi:hypothetical protein
MKIIAPAIRQNELEYSARENADIDAVYASLVIRGGLCVVHLCGCENIDIDGCCGIKKETES